MGVVYLAEQEGQIRRKVALKVIKPGMDSKRVIARFENERQALALLDHPNVAQVHDAGTTEAGRPYFVMEHVKGLPITDYCDRHKLSIEDRLRLFQQVCLAVHHAHQKGIIHRDIKPSNILVSAENDRSTPKIIDFGVAKAMSQPLTERTLFTEDSQLLGTPEYMSPEQAEMINEDIDTRSDIYSLGVLLYVLLAGVLPYDSQTFRAGGVEHIRKIIRETDPKTPSTRLTKLGEEAKKLAESRRTELAALAKCLHRELEWIPLKAMRKDRAERYRSASEMADDIENYLRGIPLLAGPPSAGYKLKKFVRRNPVLVGGIAAVLAVLATGVVVSTLFAVGQARARAEAQLIADFLEEDVLGAAGEAMVSEATVSFILDEASKTLRERFRDKPLIEASLSRTLGNVYSRLGEQEDAERHLLHAIGIYRRYYGDEGKKVLGIRNTLGYVYLKQGRGRDAHELFANLLEIYQRHNNLTGQIHSINGLAATCRDVNEGASWFEKALQLEDTWRQQGAQGFDMSPWLKGNLACKYSYLGQYEKAEELFLQAIPVISETNGSYMAHFGRLYEKLGRYEKAEAILREALARWREFRGDEDLHTLECKCALAQFLIGQNQLEEAEELLGEALPIARRRFRPKHWLTLALLNARAVLCTKQEEYDQAEALFEELLQDGREERDYDPYNTLQLLHDFGVLRREQGRYEEAEELLIEALEE